MVFLDARQAVSVSLKPVVKAFDPAVGWLGYRNLAPNMALRFGPGRAIDLRGEGVSRRGE
jgi:hypothetical protein